MSKSIPGAIFLQAPIIVQFLDDIDSKLTHIDQFFRIVGVLNSLITTQRSEMREFGLAIASSCLSVSTNADERQRICLELESRLGELMTRSLTARCRSHQADYYFVLGLIDFKPCTGGIIRHHLEPQRIESASRNFRKACNLGKKEAYRYLGDVFFDGYGVDSCLSTAVSMYQQGVARGDPSSKARLAHCYEFGHGIQMCRENTIRLYREASDEGCGEAMYSYGHFKFHGKHIPSNYGTAVRLLSKAVDLRVDAAKGDLALCYEKGIGFERDPVKSFELLRQAFDAGSMFCIVELARCYDTGSGVEVNPEEATRAYEKCVNSGTWLSDFYKSFYGLRLIKGHGIEKNVQRGKAIVIDATKCKNAISWFVLGECYRYGFG